MSLTLDQAATAGALAVGITAAETLAAQLQARIDEGIPIAGMSADLADGTSIRATLAMTADETAALLGAVKTVCLAKRDTLLAALAALTE